MADIANELMYELPKKVHVEVSGLKDAQREIRAELDALRGAVVDPSGPA